MIQESGAGTVLSLTSLLWRSGLALFLVLANGFFVAAEFAMVAARRGQIDALARAGHWRAKLARSAMAKMDYYISGSQLGITLASLGLGWVGESTVAGMVGFLFARLPAPMDVVATHAVAGAVAFTVITFMHIVLGEQVPKYWALVVPETAALWTAGPLIVFSKIFRPFIVLLNGSANLLLRATGFDPLTGKERVHRPEEIEMLLTQSYEHGLLREEPVEMIRGIFHLSETTAAEVMTPRTEVIGLSADVTLEEAAELILSEGHSRYPVYEDTIDHIIGVVLARDVWKAQRDGLSGGLREIVREVPFVPDTKPVEHLLRDMQSEQTHISVVIDEFGGTSGIVTIEDVVEEIVGEIEDELDEAVTEFTELTDHIEFRGSMPITELNDRYGLTLPDEDYTTVGGFVLGRLGRVARVGDVVSIVGGTLKVLSMKGRRVDRLSLKLLAGPRELEHTET
jgi:magnesium and cobalt exporter, CNNM family